jgi:CHAD domain-containing protein
MNPHVEHLQRLTAKLRQNLHLCAPPANRKANGHQPSVDAVHDVRTGTRRIEAILDSIRTSLQSSPARPSAASESTRQALADATERWQKLLKKIRRSAGAIRDLDVHRHLLRDLLEEITKRAAPADSAEMSESSAKLTPSTNLSSRESEANRGTRSLLASLQSLVLEESVAEPPVITPLQKQAEDLDAWLKHTRQEHSTPLVDGAKKWADKLDAHLAALAEALQSQPARRRKPASAAATALEAFAKLSSEMQQLHAENLHDFRKGAKKARYMAETGGEDEYAGAIGKALKKLQDEIGDWHDWLVLAEEAHRALGDHGTELIARIEQERESHYTQAMKTAEKMRGRLMGEWRASASKPRRAAVGTQL